MISPAAERLALASILVLALALRFWGLEQNGWGADYYSAAALSMSGDWHRFLFAAFDPAGFLSVDKPPVALWLQVLSAKVLGFRPLSVILPSILAGVASVAILHRLVRPAGGPAAALVAAFLFATTPIWVAVNRTNNMDSVLLLVLLGAAWALTLAAQSGSRRQLFLAMALVGVAFNVKMLAGWMVLPAFALAYFLAAPVSPARRIADLALGGVVALAVSAPWVALVHFTPASERPYVGSSRDNAILELVVGHNAVSRFGRPSAPDVSGAPAKSADAPARAADAPTAKAPDSPAKAASRPIGEATPADDLGDDAGASARAIVQRAFVRAPTGPMRLASGQLAAQFGWLLPLAIAGLVAGLARLHRGSATSRGDPLRVAVLLWLGWIATYWLVYGYLGGIIHFYYLSTLAPAFAALAAMGVVALWERFREGGRPAWALPLVLALGALWQVHVQASAMGWTLEALASPREAWLGVAQAVAAAGIVLALLGMVAAILRRPSDAPPTGTALALLVAGLVSLLVLPMAWTASAVLLPAHGVMPSADLYRLLVAARTEEAIEATRFGQSPDTTKLAAFLQHQRGGERFLVATSTAYLAAPLILGTGEPVMARGGFHGLDATLTPEGFAERVRGGQVRFAMVGDLTTANRRMGGDRAGRPLAAWIRRNGKPVDPGLWRGPGMPRRAQLYDMRPELGLRPPAPPAS